MISSSLSLSHEKSSRAGVYAVLLLLSTGTLAATAPGPAPDRVGENLPETSTRYQAMHAALIAAGFPDEIKEQCASITDFAKPASWSRSNACTKSKGSRSWDAKCTPECIEYFEKSGIECELAEDAAKLQVAKALDAALEGAPMKGNDKKALFAWYRFIYSLNGDEDEEGVKVDTLVDHIKEEIASGDVNSSTLKFFNTQLSDERRAGWESDSKAAHIAKCVKQSAGGAAIDSLPGSSALSHGSFVSGVIGSVAYAALLM